jgi:hypothetical protein
MAIARIARMTIPHACGFLVICRAPRLKGRPRALPASQSPRTGEMVQEAPGTVSRPGRRAAIAFSDKGGPFAPISSVFFRRSEGEQVIVGIEKLGLQSWMTTPDQLVKR